MNAVRTWSRTHFASAATKIVVMTMAPSLPAPRPRPTALERAPSAHVSLWLRCIGTADGHCIGSEQHPADLRQRREVVDVVRQIRHVRHQRVGSDARAQLLDMASFEFGDLSEISQVFVER